VKHAIIRFASLTLLLGFFAVPRSHAQFNLLAIGTLDKSSAGTLADLSGLHYKLENGDPANLLGGFGSAIAYAGNTTFLALPDRGPNAVSFDSAIDDTVIYINRFHTVTMDLELNTTGHGRPFTLTPTLSQTTLLSSPTALVYGTGDGLGVGSGAPALNDSTHFYFTGRSDNFDPSQNSGDSLDARFDTEGMRVSNDGTKVYISDEYGPYVYEFNRSTGQRLRSFALPCIEGSPSCFFVSNLFPVGAAEISGNTVGRTANKGMEGLAITPDGKTLVGIVQASLLQDAAQGGSAASLLRIATIDIASGRVMHQFAYLLTAGSGVSEIVALNNHEFIVDERDGHGRADQSKAKVKQLFKIDLNGATDVSSMDGLTASTFAVTKTLFLDNVQLFTSSGIAATAIPAKIEGIAFGADVKFGGQNVHTLWIGNDNDFLSTTTDPDGNTIPNPNQFFVVGFTDAALGGSKYVPQPIQPLQ
jgi:Esterase-like activity of phytase